MSHLPTHRLDQSLAGWYDEGFIKTVEQAMTLRASGRSHSDTTLAVADELHKVSSCILADILTAVVMRAVSEKMDGELPSVD